jgi:hypothetical protein
VNQEEDEHGYEEEQRNRVCETASKQAGH